jgi:hypothetical protein
VQNGSAAVGHALVRCAWGGGVCKALVISAESGASETRVRKTMEKWHVLSSAFP